LVDIFGRKDFDDARLFGLLVKTEIEEACSSFCKESFDFEGTNFFWDGRGFSLFFFKGGKGVLFVEFYFSFQG